MLIKCVQDLKVCLGSAFHWVHMFLILWCKRGENEEKKVFDGNWGRKKKKSRQIERSGSVLVEKEEY